MGKKKARIPASSDSRGTAKEPDRTPVLKDLLGSEALEKLKAKADELRQQEAQEREQKRLAAEERRRQEQKRLDNDFEHLLNNSKMDWKKFK